MTTTITIRPKTKARKDCLLLHLPNEILFHILNQLDSPTLGCLTIISRRLRIVAQSIIFEGQKSHLQDLVYSGHLSCHGDDVNQIFNKDECNLSIPYLAITIGPDTSPFESLHSLYELLSRVSQVGLVKLTLSASARESWVYHTARTKWMYLLGAVLDLIVERSQSRLTVTRGNDWQTIGKPFNYIVKNLPTDHSALCRPAWPVRLLNKLKSKLSTHKTTSHMIKLPVISRIPRPCYVILSPSRVPILREFHIHSSILLRLPFFSWTLQLLNTAPIEKLSFRVADLLYHDWEYILSAITIPTLSQFSPGSSSIAFPDLQSFLARHPTITALDLYKVIPVGHPILYPPKVNLPQLTKLVASPEYLTHFLQPPEAFPALRFIAMTSEYNIGSLSYQYRQLDVVLGYIAKRTREIALTLRCVSQVNLDGWFRSIRYRLERGAFERIPNVRSLVIEVKSLSEPSVLDDLIHFLALFPALRQFNFEFGRVRGYNPFGWEQRVWAIYPKLKINGVGKRSN